MITNITKGVDPFRVQQNKPPYFVSWKQDGKQHYAFYHIVSAMYTHYDRLIASQS